MTGEIMGKKKYDGISPKPPIFPGHNLTCPKFQETLSFLSVPDASANTMINDDI